MLKQNKAKVNYVQQFGELLTKFSSETEEFQKEKEKWEQEKAKLRKGQLKLEDDVIVLNVGGTHFTTTVSTLSAPLLPPPDYPVDSDDEFDSDDEDGMVKKTLKTLAATSGSSAAGSSVAGAIAQPGEEDIPDEAHYFSTITSDRFEVVKDQNGNILIDRDAGCFRFILNYLRAKGDFTKFSLPWENETMISQLIAEAEFYNLKSLLFVLKKGGLPEGTGAASRSTFVGGMKSSIIKSSEQKKWLLSKLPKAKFKLIFKASKDGFTSAAFHAKCDNQGPTVIIAQTNGGSIFGGYAAAAWNSSNGYINAGGSFLFSLQFSTNQTLRMYTCNTPQYALRGLTSYVVYFGADMYIANNCNVAAGSAMTGGSYYMSQDGTYPANTESPCVIKDFEVFSVHEK